MAWATANVPWLKGSISNTPMGPFQKILLAGLISSENRAIVSGPMSRQIHPVETASFFTICRFASTSIRSAAT
jgi:hypothetical protein